MTLTLKTMNPITTPPDNVIDLHLYRKTSPYFKQSIAIDTTNNKKIRCDSNDAYRWWYSRVAIHSLYWTGEGRTLGRALRNARRNFNRGKC